MAQIHTAEPGTVPVAVPVQGQRPQREGEPGGDRQQIVDLCALGGGQGVGAVAGGFQDAYGVLGVQQRGQPATFPGEFGEPVETTGETVRLAGRGGAAGTVLYGRRVPGLFAPVGRAPGRPVSWRHGGEGGHQGAEALGETAPFAPSGAAAPALLGPSAASAGELPPQGRAAHQPYVLRQFGAAARFQAGAGAQGVDLEVMAGESAHEPVAPRVRLTGRIRIAVFGEQSNAHECTPVLPVGVPGVPAARPPPAGRRYAKGRWRDGRLSIAPPEGVKARNFPPLRAFRRAM